MLHFMLRAGRGRRPGMLWSEGLTGRRGWHGWVEFSSDMAALEGALVARVARCLDRHHVVTSTREQLPEDD